MYLEPCLGPIGVTMFTTKHLNYIKQVFCVNIGILGKVEEDDFKTFLLCNSM